MTGIYKILNIVNGNFYIGSALNFKKRKSFHLRDLKNDKHHNKHLQNAYNKYGKDNFIFELISICEKENLMKIEQYYIDSTNPQYNIQRIAGGSALGLKRSKETCERISKALTGKKASRETRLKQSQAKIGKYIGSKSVCSIRIIQYDLDDNFIKKYYSVSEASIESKILRTAINNCLTKRSKTAGGFKWKYEKEVKID